MEIFPSEEISNSIEFQIHKNYDLNGLSIEEFVKLIDNKSKCKYVLDSYFEKYPSLNIINNKHETHDILRGIVSKFNEQDIKFFVDDWLNINKNYSSFPDYIPTSNRVIYDNIVKIFEIFFKKSIGYVISPYTLKLINDKFNVMDSDLLNSEIKRLNEI